MEAVFLYRRSRTRSPEESPEELSLTIPYFNFYLENAGKLNYGTGKKRSDNRILFQNADGDINMGVCFNDPDINAYDMCWFGRVAIDMRNSFCWNEGLVFEDEEWQTLSCYVELHRNGYFHKFMATL